MPESRIPVAAVAYLNPAGELLMHLRDNDPRIPLPHHWDVIGGMIEAGETPEVAARRESLEEIGEEPTTLTFLRQYQTEAADIHVFTAGIDKNADELVLGEGEALAFFSLREVSKRRIVPWTRRLIEDLCAGGRMR